MKRDPKNDTDPIRPPIHRTQPYGLPLAALDETEEAVTPAPTEEEIRETEELLAPIRQAVPEPARTRRAQSEGGASVSYSAIGAPAVRTLAERQRALVELDKLVSAPDPSPERGAERNDGPTFALPTPPSRRRLPLVAVIGVTVIITAGATIALARLVPGIAAPAVAPTDKPAAPAVPAATQASPTHTVAAPPPAAPPEPPQEAPPPPPTTAPSAPAASAGSPATGTTSHTGPSPASSGPSPARRPKPRPSQAPAGSELYDDTPYGH